MVKALKKRNQKRLGDILKIELKGKKTLLEKIEEQLRILEQEEADSFPATPPKRRRQEAESGESAEQNSGEATPSKKLAQTLETDLHLSELE